MTIVGEIVEKARKQRPHPKKHDTYKSDGKKSGRHGNAERKIEVANNNLGAILRERKEKGAQEQEQGEGTTQLGLIGLCGAITKQPEKPRGYGVQYVDLKINGKPACAFGRHGVQRSIS
ncbi:hypothetical protein KY284_006410 [Solanum tuberosum]|nr:hypothetical protein KY284_006410 [Solanum tuberosum]